MFSLFLSILLVLAPAADRDLEQCRALASSTTPLPVAWSDVEAAWTGDVEVSPDTVRTALARVRKARRCFRTLDTTAVSQPHLEPLVQTFFREATLLSALRRFDAAFDAFEQGRAYLAEGPSAPHEDGAPAEWTRRLHLRQGYLHYQLGNLSSSIEHYLGAYRATPTDAIEQRTLHLVDVGLLQQRTQDFRAAQQYYRRAKQLLRREGSHLPPNASVRVRLSLAQTDLLLEKATNAEYDRAALRRARARARESRRRADSTSDNHALATLYLSQSQGFLGNIEAARTLNEEVRRYARAEEDLSLLNSVLRTRGQIQMQADQFSRAEATLNEGLALARSREDLNAQRRLLELLGRLHEMQEEWSAAEQYYREGASVVETYQESLTASQWSMTAFEEWRAVHRGLVRTLLARDRPEEALKALDRSRARHLQNLRTRSRLAQQLPDDRRARFDSLTQALTTVRTRLNAAEGALRDSLNTRETALMAARQQVLRVDSIPPRPSIDRIQAYLDRHDRAIVSYFLDDPFPLYDRSLRSVALVVTADSLRTVSLPGLTRDSVQTHVDGTSPLFRPGRQASRANTMHFDLAPLHALYEAVYAPVAERLPDNRPLTVVPDGPLFRVPFSMLVGAMPGGRFAPAEARYVVHERATSVSLATSLVADTATGASWSTFDPEVAAYGVTDYGGRDDADTAQAPSPSFRSVLPNVSLNAPSQIPSLPGVERELRSLESTVGGVRVALNDDATESHLRHDIRRAGVLHVAAHAVVNPSSPFQNALLLHPDSSSDAPSSDGVLHLHELRGRTDIPLVVLSACNTARGPLRGGEGMEGLQYAFRAMGTRSTLSTLWAVSDDASVTLMTSFYRHLRTGVSKDQALRQAQLDYLRAHPNQASPFFWAAPALYGSTAPVPLQTPSAGAWPSAWLWGGLTVLGVLGLTFGLLWQRRTRLPEPFCNVGRPA